MNLLKYTLILVSLVSLASGGQVAFASSATTTDVDKQLLAENAKNVPPDGDYDCNNKDGKSPVNLGTLQIKGTTFRGLVTEGDFNNYKIDAAGNITWSKELTGLEDGWKLTTSKYKGTDKAGHATIEINYTTKDGKPSTMVATKN